MDYMSASENQLPSGDSDLPWSDHEELFVYTPKILNPTAIMTPAAVLSRVVAAFMMTFAVAWVMIKVAYADGDTRELEICKGILLNGNRDQYFMSAHSAMPSFVQTL